MSGELVADESFVEMRFTASCEGVLGTAKIYNDGSFTFNSHMASTLRHMMLQDCLHGHHDEELHGTANWSAAGAFLTDSVATALLLQEPES